MRGALALSWSRAEVCQEVQIARRRRWILGKRLTVNARCMFRAVCQDTVFFWGGGGWHPSYYYPLLRVLGSVSNTEFSERGLFGDCFGEVVPKVARSARMPSKTSAPPKV